MAYWKHWRSLIGGGVAFILLGLVMFFLFTMAPGQSGMLLYGAVFVVAGIVMIIAGWLLRKEPDVAKKN